MVSFDWMSVRSFLGVAEHGSYSAAARALGISQPTIGRHIGQLQAQLGVTLFGRVRGGYVLTSAGADLIAHARAMQLAAATLTLAAEGKAEEVAGTVRITASEIMATYVLPPIMVAFRQAEPSIQIELTATNSTENLLLREADIAVRMVRPDQPDLIARKLGEIEIGLFAAPTYFQKFARPKTPEHLRQHCLLGFDRSDMLIKGMAALGFSTQRETFCFRTDNQVAYFEALKAGMGIGVAQVALAHASGLCRVLPQTPIPALPVWLASHRELRTSARVRRVFDFLAENLLRALKST
jgi:DNA-binding transcriptional LysR family regulator